MSIERLGPYRLERVLGRGGMGTVYAAINETSDERAAVKVLAPALAAEENFRERFAAEIESLKKLKHPNIIQLYGYGEEHGHLFYAMELVTGNNLQEELAAGRRFDWREVTRIGIDMCQALKHAHDHGVIHRDLKPANLLLNEDDEVKLADFGIAKLFGFTQLTSDGGVVGTADYMSPEQAAGAPVTPRCDLYSLGSSMYAMLAGRPPFCGKSLAEVVHKLRFDEPIPVSRLAPDVPDALDELISQLLAKDAKDRVPTALAVSHRLKAMEHALTIHAERFESQSDSTDGEPSAVAASEHESDDPELAHRLTADMPTIDRPSASAAESALSDAGQGRAVAEDESAGVALTATDSDRKHFTTVDKEDAWRRERLGEPRDVGGPLWFKVLFTAAILGGIGLVAGYAFRPPTPDQVYARIVDIAELDDPRHLANAEADIQQFLQDFADDPRREEVAGYLEAIELYRVQRKLERQARSRSQDEALSPVELLYLEALRLAEASPESCAARLQALIDVYGDRSQATSHEKRCVELARARLEQLRESIKRLSAEHLTAVESSLTRAQEMQAENPAAATAIWRGVIELYRDKPWAADAVRRAQQHLDDVGLSGAP